MIPLVRWFVTGIAGVCLALPCEAQAQQAHQAVAEIDAKIAELQQQLDALKSARKILAPESNSDLDAADAAFAVDDYNGILTSYSAILAQDPMNTTAYYRRAYGLQKLGRLEEAIRDYSTYIEYVPHDAKALNNRAAAYLATGNRGLAEIDLQVVRRLQGQAQPGTSGSSPSALAGEYSDREYTSKGQPIFTGPRGGRYHYSGSGKKVYERRR